LKAFLVLAVFAKVIVLMVTNWGQVWIGNSAYPHQAAALGGDQAMPGEIALLAWLVASGGRMVAAFALAMAGAAAAHESAAAARQGTGPERARATRANGDPQRGLRGPTLAAADAPAALDSLSRLQQLADASPRVAQLRRLQALADGQFAPAAQLAGGPEEEELVQGQFASAELQPPLQQAPRANNTGLPNQLKSGIESLSGLSMDDVRVHYNSSQPAQLNALAYAQGSDIHLAPGQERHLPHEAWHVVQQAQGRVRPTTQMKDGVPVNDDVGLEREADVMGSKALEGRQRVVDAHHSISVPIETAQSIDRDATNSLGVNVANNDSAPLANGRGSAQRGGNEMQRIADQCPEAALPRQVHLPRREAGHGPVRLSRGNTMMHHKPAAAGLVAQLNITVNEGKEGKEDLDMYGFIAAFRNQVDIVRYAKDGCTTAEALVSAVFNKLDSQTFDNRRQLQNRVIKVAKSLVPPKPAAVAAVTDEAKQQPAPSAKPAVIRGPLINEGKKYIIHNDLVYLDFKNTDQLYCKLGLLANAGQVELLNTFGALINKVTSHARQGKVGPEGLAKTLSALFSPWGQGDVNAAFDETAAFDASASKGGPLVGINVSVKGLIGELDALLHATQKPLMDGETVFSGSSYKDEDADVEEDVDVSYIDAQGVLHLVEAAYDDNVLWNKVRSGGRDSQKARYKHLAGKSTSLLQTPVDRLTDKQAMEKKITDVVFSYSIPEAGFEQLLTWKEADLNSLLRLLGKNISVLVNGERKNEEIMAAANPKLGVTH
jgi:hypothetical protein